MSNCLFEVEQLSFSTGEQSILRDVSFDVRRGEYLSIIGPNGAGKTTLLKCLNRIIAGWTGDIRLDGIPVREYSQRELGRRIGYVPQQGSRTSMFTVHEFILMGRYPHLSAFAPLQESDRVIADDVMKLVHVRHLKDRQISTLSGGELQRMHIAAALAQEAQCLLLDEPTTFLDYKYQIEILDLLDKLHRDRGLTIISVTHDINSAVSFSDRILAMKDGSAAFHGTPDELLGDSTLEEIFDTRFQLVSLKSEGVPVFLHNGRSAS